MDLESPVAILTGCASGIGKPMARSLISRGYNLVLADLNFEILETQFQEVGDTGSQIILKKLDIGDEEQWRDMFDLAIQTWGRVDVLMNFANYVRPAFLHASEAAEVMRHFQTNAVGPMLGTRIAAERMISQGYGQIINLAHAEANPLPGLSLYTASRYAMRGFSLAVAQELRPHNVYLTVICPDPVKNTGQDLRMNYQEALTFAGEAYASFREIERAIFDEALPNKPLEILLPRRRGWLAKLSSAMPTLSAPLAPWLRKKSSQAKQPIENQW